MSIFHPSNSTSLRILALGDSYTIGEGVPPCERWPEQLAERLREKGLNALPPTMVAHTGWTTGELAAALADSPPSGPFNLVTLLVGVNNQYRGRSLEEYRREFQALLEQAVAFAGGQARRVIVLSIPDWGVTPFAQGRDRERIAAEIGAFNAANQAVTREVGVVYVDVTPDSRQAAEDGSLLAPDGLHPSGKMYAAWVDRVLSEALRVLGE